MTNTTKVRTVMALGSINKFCKVAMPARFGANAGREA
jgi:hypothetical protein